MYKLGACNQRLLHAFDQSFFLESSNFIFILQVRWHIYNPFPVIQAQDFFFGIYMLCVPNYQDTGPVTCVCVQMIRERKHSHIRRPKPSWISCFKGFETQRVLGGNSTELRDQTLLIFITPIKWQLSYASNVTQIHQSLLDIIFLKF